MEAFGIGLFLFVRHFGGNRAVYRRDDIERDGFDVAWFLVEGDRHVIVFAERHLAVAELAVFGRPYQHVAFTGGEESLAIRIGFLVSDRVELGIVVDLELHIGSSGRQAVLVYDGDRRFGGRGIIVDHVDLGVAVGYVHHLFRPVVFAEYLRVHQHTAISRPVEPS